jgi:hypothetical protein
VLVGYKPYFDAKERFQSFMGIATDEDITFDETWDDIPYDPSFEDIDYDDCLDNAS